MENYALIMSWFSFNETGSVKVLFLCLQMLIEND